MEVAYDLHVLEHDQPALDQLLERGQEHLDPFRLVDDLDPLGQIFRQPQQVRPVDAGGLAEAHHAQARRCPRDSQFPALLDNGRDQVAAPPGVAVADVDGDPLGFAFDLHRAQTPVGGGRGWGLFLHYLFCRRSRYGLPRIVPDLDRTSDHETLGDHGVQLDLQLTYICTRIDDLHDDRDVEGEIITLGVANLLVCSIAEIDQEDRGP